MAWEKISEFEFITETEGKAVVSAGDMLSGGSYKELAHIRNNRADRPENSTHRLQDIDGVLFYYRWQ